MKKIDLQTFLYDSRVAAGLTQMEVASKLGYKSPQFVSNWERGLSSPPITIVMILSDMYGVDEQELFDLMVKSSLARVEATMREDYKLIRKHK
jgi:transcriptional regulator with XRE-family HTH domain